MLKFEDNICGLVEQVTGDDGLDEMPLSDELVNLAVSETDPLTFAGLFLPIKSWAKLTSYDKE